LAKFGQSAGLSVPAGEGQTEYVSRNSFPSAHLMTGQSPAIRMATIAAQKVVIPLAVFGCTGDEMDIKRFVSRWGLMRRIKWTTSTASGTVIADWYANPGNGHVNLAKWYFSPLSFVAGLFAFFRGGIDYEFVMSKTKLVSGQLEIIWQLGTAEAPVTKDSETANCYRIIWDIQESSSLRVHLPYCSMLKWCQVVIADDSSPIVPPIYTYNHTNGAIIVRVLNPLVNADATVAQSVDILVRTRGAPDIEFACPSPSLAFVGFLVNPGPEHNRDVPLPHSKPLSKLEGKEEAVAQGGDIFQDFNEDAAKPPITLSQSTPHTPYGAITCIGECIGNLRLLTRRMLPITRRSFNLSFTYYVDHYSLFNYHAFVTWLSYGFAFWTGGARYWVRFPFKSYVRNLTTASLNLDAWLFSLDIYSTFGYAFGVPLVPQLLGDPVAAHVSLTEAENSAVLDIPYQSVVPFMPIGSLSFIAALYQPLVKLSVQGSLAANTLTSNISPDEHIGAADDFSMGWQIGPPPCGYTPIPYQPFYWDGYA